MKELSINKREIAINLPQKHKNTKIVLKLFLKK